MLNLNYTIAYGGKDYKVKDVLTEQDVKNTIKLQNDITNQVGYRVDVTTLTALSRIIAEQKFYEIPVADYLPVSVNTEAAYAEKILNYKTFVTGGDFEEGIINQGRSTRLATVDAAVSAVTSDIYNWAKMTEWGHFEVAQAARSGNWDIFAAKEEARRTNWDLGIQKTVFLGNGDINSYGLANLPNIANDTTLAPVPLYAMSLQQLNNFAVGLINAYQANTGYSELKPNRLIIPQSEWNGLSTYFEDAGRSTVRTRLDALRQIFVDATQNNDFKILPLTYTDSTYTGRGQLDVVRYILYRYDPKTVRFEIPVDYTVTVGNTLDGFTWRNVGIGQFSDVIPLRPNEIYYVDRART